MLIEFTVKNYKSFEKEQTLSLIPSNKKGDDKLDNNILHIDSQYSLLATAVIYGANAAGKSNLLKALFIMSKIILTSANKQRGSGINVAPFKLGKVYNLDSPTQFTIQFIQDNVRYEYGFSTTRTKIITEWLYAYPKSTKQKWFERKLNSKSGNYDFNFSQHLKGQKKLWMKSTRAESLFLSNAVNLNSEQLQPAYDWFSKKLDFSDSDDDDFSSTLKLYESNEKNAILNYLKTADLQISDFSPKVEKFDKNKLRDSIPTDIKEEIINNFKDKELLTDIVTKHKNINDELISFSFLTEESEGTKIFFQYSGIWIETLKKGSILFVDELNNSLHPHLVKFLVKMFQNKKTNPNNAQLIFTTHETSLLSEDIFRRDQIYLCEKNKDYSSELFSLSDFSNCSSRDNFEARYLSGRYGATPFIDESIFEN